MNRRTGQNEGRTYVKSYSVALQLKIKVHDFFSLKLWQFYEINERIFECVNPKENDLTLFEHIFNTVL